MAVPAGCRMKPVRRAVPSIVAMVLGAVIACSGQEVRIASLDRAGRLGFTLSPTGTVYDYSCVVEWCSSIREGGGGWTNSWYLPFTRFSPSNGVSCAGVPRFFQISCVTGTLQATNPPGWTNYTVTGVTPAWVVDGLLCWTNTGDMGVTYYVEYAAKANGDWLGQWACWTNIHTTTIATNVFGLPMLFRVVTIKAKTGGELPW